MLKILLKVKKNIKNLSPTKFSTFFVTFISKYVSYNKLNKTIL